MTRNINPIAMMLKAQQSSFARWLLGLGRFNVMPTRPGEDPVQRIQTRLLTILTAMLALAATVLTLASAGVAALLAATARPAGWILLVGAAVSLLAAVRSLWRSLRAIMPAPGAAYLAGTLDVLALTAAAIILLRP